MDRLADTDRRIVRLLIVDDDEDDVLLTRDLLDQQQRTRFQVDSVDSFEAGIERIRSGAHDVYLIDHRLGKRTGLELVREAFGDDLTAPVIVLTGFDDYEVDREANLIGATDFLVKRELSSTLLERSIRYALRHHDVLAELRASEDRFALAVRGANDGIWDWDLTRDEVYYAPRWKSFLGYADDEIGSSPEEWLGRVHPDDQARLRRLLDNHLANRSTHLEVEHRVKHADGRYRWMLTRGVAVRDQQGEPVRVAGSMSDITARKAAEARLVHDALHDPLTGLPNRAMLLDRLELLLSRAERDPAYRCAVLFVDLDRFKLINDAYSHAAGDKLLIAVGRRLKGLMRPGDTVARLGGDEFTLLLDGAGDAEEAVKVADRIQGALEEPFEVEGRSVVVSAAIGIAISEPGSTPDELMRNADIAMYDTKSRGEKRIAVFDVGMRSRVVSQLELENELRSALERGKMRVFYQPIIAIADGGVVGFEALSRWPADRGVVYPDQFIPVAEATGLIWDLSRHVMSTALSDLTRWRAERVVGEDVSVSVNVSATQLGDERLIADIQEALAVGSVTPSCLRLEITESTIMREPDRMPAALDELERLGVRVHVDDFGTGYSSLTSLRHFAGRTLKVDRSFVSSIGTDIGSEEIVRTIIALASTLGLEVIAEGVEEYSQLEVLRRLGCRFAQGFLFARPAPADKIAAAVSNLAAAQPAAAGGD